MKLTDAKVLITGGSSGIGAATAKLLIEKGANVAIAARNKDRLEAVANELKAVLIQADICREEDVTRMVKSVHEELGGLNVLVNNAAYGYTSPLLEIEKESFSKLLVTNVIGAALCAREAARYFVRQNYGNIINIGSTSALKGSPSGSPYTATKYALRGMTECWRAELRPHNIRVMLVNPSEVMTNFASSRESATGKQEKTYTENEKKTKLRGEEIAHTIASLLEMDDRGFITEATIFATNPQV